MEEEQIEVNGQVIETINGEAPDVWDLYNDGWIDSREPWKVVTREDYNKAVRALRTKPDDINRWL